MTVRKIRFAYFTPIQLTRRVVYCIVSGMGNGIPSEQYNLTAVAERERQQYYAPDELLVVALPSYGGRVPQLDPPLLRNLHGEGSPAVVVTTYGGRGYDDTLLEMQDILKEQGFVTIAGAAFVTAHAMSVRKVEPGRPDAKDIQLARTFGAKVREKLEASDGMPAEVILPGNVPYVPGVSATALCPSTSDKCVLCMQCFRWCPTDAITYNDPNVTDAARCVLCQGCVVRCPVDARQVLDEGFRQRIAGLEAGFAGKYAEAEMFL